MHRTDSYSPRVVAVTLVALFIGCASSSLEKDLAATESRFAKIHNRVDDYSDEVNDAEKRAAELRQLVDDTIKIYDEAKNRYHDAENAYA